MRQCETLALKGAVLQDLMFLLQCCRELKVHRNVVQLDWVSSPSILTGCVAFILRSNRFIQCGLITPEDEGTVTIKMFVTDHPTTQHHIPEHCNPEGLFCQWEGIDKNQRGKEVRTAYNYQFPLLCSLPRCHLPDHISFTVFFSMWLTWFKRYYLILWIVCHWQGIQSSYSWRYNGHDEPEREQRRKFRVEKKLQELEELQDKEAASAALDDTYHDIVEFAHNYFNSHERSPEGKFFSNQPHVVLIFFKLFYKKGCHKYLKDVCVNTVELNVYCLELMRTDLTLTWGQVPYGLANLAETTYWSCQKCKSALPYQFSSTGHHSFGIQFITSLKSNLCTDITRWNTTKNKEYEVAHTHMLRCVGTSIDTQFWTKVDVFAYAVPIAWLFYKAEHQLG